MAELGAPPNFLSNGDPPLICSAAALIACGFEFGRNRYGIKSGSAELLTAKEVLAPEFAEVKTWLRQLPTPGPRGAIGGSATPALLGFQIYRFSYGMFWQREDPISQLPPGASLQKRVKLEVGITDSASAELTASLGLSGTIGPAELSAKLGSCLKRTVTITRHTTVETTMTLTNSGNKYRCYALWQRIHGIWVSALTLRSDGEFEWSPISTTHYADPNSSAVNVTYSDVST